MITFHLTLGQETAPSVTWVPAEDDPTTELLQPSFTPLHRTTYISEVYDVGKEVYTYCQASFGVSASIIRASTSSRFNFYVNWMKIYNISRLRLPYRRIPTNARMVTSIGNYYVLHPGTENLAIDAAAAAFWAPGYPQRANNATLDFSTYISAEHNYSMVDDRALNGSRDVVMICQRPVNGNKSTPNNIGMKSTKPGWRLLSNRVQEVKLVHANHSRSSALCTAECAVLPALHHGQLFDLTSLSAFARSMGINRFWMQNFAREMEPRMFGDIGLWLPGHPLPHQAAWMNYSSNPPIGETTLMEVAESLNDTGLRFARNYTDQSLPTAAIICVRTLAACSNDDPQLPGCYKST